MTLLRDRALIGDRATVALVGADGALDWCCFGSPDANPALYGLLDPDGAAVRIGAAHHPAQSTIGMQTYERGGAPIVRTIASADGALYELADHIRAGAVVRVLTVLRGTMTASVTVTPGRVDGPVRRVERWSEGVSFAGVRVHGEAVGGNVVLHTGERTVVTVRSTRDPEGGLRLDEALASEERLRNAWRRSLAEAAYDGLYGGAVTTSLMMLRMLTMRTSGALIGAPTTSLPVRIGSERNTDQRAAWLRDNATAVRVLEMLRLTEWADEIRMFLAEVGRRDLPLPPVVNTAGEPLRSETDLSLPGWRNTGPVLAGNRAGDGIDIAAMADVALVLDARRHWPQLERIAGWLAEHGLDPDHGTWDERRRPIRHVASVVGAQVALRALAAMARARDPLDVTVHGWLDGLAVLDTWLTTEGRFGSPPHAGWRRTATDNSSDAAVLRWAASTFPWALPVLPNDGPGDDVSRLATSVDQMLAQLGEGVFLNRHLPHVDDGLTPGQGPDVAASFQVVTALARLERWDAAHERMEGLCAYFQPLGLLSTHVDLDTADLRGNLPSAAAHLALIEAALILRLGPR